MKSIFLLCDYGIAYTTVKRLYDNNIKLYNIANDPDCLNKVLGEKSQKVEKIKDILPMAVNSDKDYSIYDLTIYGLSIGIIQLLKKNNININDIDEKLLKRDFITDSTYKKIMKSYDSFLRENDIHLELSSKILFYLIKKNFEYNDFTYNQIKEMLVEKNYSIETLDDLLFSLTNNKLINKKDEIFSLVKPKLISELNKISNKGHYDIVLKKLSGMTLESIGIEYNVTRERIRQIVSKELKKISPTREEEKYLETFQTYNFDSYLFSEFYNESPIVYYFLKEKYKLGEKDPSDMLDELNLSQKQLNVLKRKYNLISYCGEYIAAKRNNILLAIIKRFNKTIEYSEIIDEYNKLIKNFSVNLEELSEQDFRNIDSILNRMQNILCGAGKYYRYYDINALEENDITELNNMLNVEPGDYSAEFFFNNNSLLMKNIDIRDEYELHNLLRKVINTNNNKIVFSRMPDLLIDCSDKLEFVEGLIHELSPISLDDFTEYVHQNYGHKINTFRSLLLTNFNKYITNGILMSDCEEFTDEQLTIMKNNLTEDIYSISTIKEMLTRLFNVNDFKLINNINMQKIGYKLRGNYIMKNSISNLEAYMREVILNSEYYEVEPEMKKIGSTYSSYLYKFIYNLDLFKISEDRFITIKKLNNMGITKEKIKNFIDEIEKVIKDGEYFNLYTLDKDNFLTNLKQYDFPDCFYETLISTINDIKIISLKNNILFIKTKEQPTREKFINSFIYKDKTYIKDIKKEIYEKYNIDLYESYIKNFINKKLYYLDSSIDCVYLSKDIYEEDINDFDILQYID